MTQHEISVAMMHEHLRNNITELGKTRRVVESAMPEGPEETLLKVDALQKIDHSIAVVHAIIEVVDQHAKVE